MTVPARPLLLALLASTVLAGCARSGPPARAGDAPGDAPVSTTETPGEPGAPPPTAPDGAPPAPGQTADGAPVVPGAPGAPGTPAAPERHGPPLPELRVKSFGLHIGGSARDAAAREAFQKALERGSWRYLECYQLIEQPGSEGTFGADLRVEGPGGKPTVRQVRTKLRGAEFRTCMEQALASAKFDPTPSGRSVVVSYSLKFSFAW